jgi:hypothetical protein
LGKKHRGIMPRHEVVMQDLRCFFPKGKHQLQTASFTQSGRRILVAILNGLATPTEQKVAKGNAPAQFIRSTSCARALRARASRCRSARWSHPSLPPSARCLKHRSRQRARRNGSTRIHRGQWLRNYARASRATMQRCLWHRQPHLSPQTLSAKPTLVQLAAALQSGEAILNSAFAFEVRNSVALPHQRCRSSRCKWPSFSAESLCCFIT